MSLLGGDGWVLIPPPYSVVGWDHYENSIIWASKMRWMLMMLRARGCQLTTLLQPSSPVLSLRGTQWCVFMSARPVTQVTLPHSVRGTIKEGMWDSRNKLFL